MKKYIYAASIIFLNAFYLYSMEEKYSISKVDIKFSYFKNNPHYVNTLGELLSSNYYDLSSRSFDISPIENMVYDVQAKQVKENVKDYADKINFQAKKEKFTLYRPSEEYYPIASLKEMVINKILQVGRTAWEVYDDKELENIFKDYPLEELLYFLRYPGVPQRTKLSILDAQKKQNIKNDDYALEIQRFVGLAEIPNRQEKELDQVLSTLACLPRLDDVKKKEMISYLVGISLCKNNLSFKYIEQYLDQGGDPLPYLKEAVIFFVEKGIEAWHPVYRNVIDYAFKRYPLYAATVLMGFVFDSSNQIFSARDEKFKNYNGESAGKIAFAIVAGHGLLQQAIENDPSMIQRLWTRSPWTLILNGGINFNFVFNREYMLEKHPNLKKEIISLFVSNVMNFERLLHLQQNGINFSNDSIFIEEALEQGKFSCFHFLLCQQKNMLKIWENYKDRFASFGFSDYCNGAKIHSMIYKDLDFNSAPYDNKFFVAYAKKFYKVLLQAHFRADALSLELFILGMQNWPTIYKNIKSIKNTSIKDKKIEDVRENINQIITELSTEWSLRFTQQYQFHIDYLLRTTKNIEKYISRWGKYYNKEANYCQLFLKEIAHLKGYLHRFKEDRIKTKAKNFSAYSLVLLIYQIWQRYEYECKVKNYMKQWGAERVKNQIIDDVDDTVKTTILKKNSVIEQSQSDIHESVKSEIKEELIELDLDIHKISTREKVEKYHEHSKFYLIMYAMLMAGAWQHSGWQELFNYCLKLKKPHFLSNLHWNVVNESIPSPEL